MFKREQILKTCQSVLGAETSERAGSAEFGKVLNQAFPSFDWQALPVHSENTVFYFETHPEKKEVDLLCYTNADTANPSHLSLWTETDFDPLAITFKKGCLYGLGAAHEKISIVAQSLGLEAFLRENQNSKANVMVAVGFGRESKMRGAKRLLSEVLNGRAVKKVLVAHPTSNKILKGSAGRIKTKVSFPFTEKERSLRTEHDNKENISSQSKIYSFLGSDNLKGNTIYKMIRSCENLPKGTVILDLDGGSSTVTEPETTYFEVDFAPPFANSMVSKFEDFADLLSDLDLELKEKFGSKELKKAIHIGRAFDSEEGVTFFGYNLIPARTTKGELDDWFAQFQRAVERVGGRVSISDAKAPYLNQGVNSEMKNCLSVTEASLFEKICKDILILGPGEEGAAKQPNEKLELESMVEACSIYYNLFKETLGGL